MSNFFFKNIYIGASKWRVIVCYALNFETKIECGYYLTNVPYKINPSCKTPPDLALKQITPDHIGVPVSKLEAALMALEARNE